MCFSPMLLNNWLSLGAARFLLLLAIVGGASRSLAQDSTTAFADSAAQFEAAIVRETASDNSADAFELAAGCTPPAAGGPSAIANTFGGSSKFFKPNQSKVFFHADQWWVTALDQNENDWFLWKKSGNTWTKTIKLSIEGSAVPDCHLEATTNKLYIFLSHSSADSPQFLRLTYNPNTDAWTKDAGFPVTLLGFTHNGENPGVLVRAKNGDFWLFVTREGSLYARRSTNDGVNWSAEVLIKQLGTYTAMCDVVSFTANGLNYIGVGYGEDTDDFSQYGFLKHKDGDANNVWSDESSKVGVPPRAFADDHISMMVSPTNTVYMVVKTNPDDQSSTGIALYKRKPAGTWSMHTVFISSAETRPALAVDETNNELYVFTTTLGEPRLGRYRKCKLEQEDSLATATSVNYFKVASDDFHNVSTPAHFVNSCTGLLVAAENNTKGNVWYQLFEIKGGAPTKPPVAIGSVVVTPATKGQAASYKIPITLGASYGLVGGTSTIVVTWPSDTELPSSMPGTMVTVNGVNAVSVAMAPLNRRATVTIPNNIAGGALVTVLFKSGAGIINPTLAGDYTLQARTNVQAVFATSPIYKITNPTATPVALGNIVVTPDTTQRTASYKIPITLGASGALTGGSGTITVTWPNDTQLPATIAKSAAKINNVNAFAVSVDAAARKAVVTVPSNLANNALVTLLFTSAAGLINPAPGDYALQVQTSKQNADATSPNYNIKALPIPKTGARFASNTKATLERSSQSKIFYFEGKWWALAQEESDSKWYLWFFNGASWSRDLLVDGRLGARADLILDAANKKLFVLGSQSTSAIFFRLLYNAGAWTIEKQVTLADFGHGPGTSPVATMTRAKNNALWVFRINNSVLEAKVSKDAGATWSAVIPLKSGLPGAKGQTEAVTFSASGNYVGVFYNVINTASGKLFGFMKHLDSDLNNVWTDETNAITRFGSEKPEGSLSAAVASNGVVYVMTRTNPATGDDPNNTLYKRTTAGTWTKFIVNIGYDWASPTLAIDATNSRLYLMGIRMNSTPNIGEYVSIAFGQESTIIDAFATVFMKNAGNNFAHLSAPLVPATSATGLMVLGGNTTTDDLWYSRIDLGLPKLAEEEPLVAEQSEVANDDAIAASVYPNPFNPSTTIRFNMKEPGRVKLQIFNLRGEVVRTLANGEHKAGLHEKHWNGHDHTGNLVASGVYFYRLQIGERWYRGRMQMIK